MAELLVAVYRSMHKAFWDVEQTILRGLVRTLMQTMTFWDIALFCRKLPMTGRHAISPFNYSWEHTAQSDVDMEVPLVVRNGTLVSLPGRWLKQDNYTS